MNTFIFTYPGQLGLLSNAGLGLLSNAGLWSLCRESGRLPLSPGMGLGGSRVKLPGPDGVVVGVDLRVEYNRYVLT